MFFYVYFLILDFFLSFYLGIDVVIILIFSLFSFVLEELVEFFSSEAIFFLYFILLTIDFLKINNYNLKNFIG